MLVNDFPKSCGGVVATHADHGTMYSTATSWRRLESTS